MNIIDLFNITQKPKLYQKGNSFMWTNPHISKQLLDVHLSENIDLASRKKTSIEKTCDWILSKAPKKQLKILDLGCGPGLYAEIFASKGHYVTGIDISKNSIEYAKNQTLMNNTNIQYYNQDYLTDDFPSETFDLVIMIFTDLGILTPDNRATLLNKVFSVLTPGGIFIFDVLSDINIEKKTSPKSWEIQESGFWKENPYICLSESFLYEEEKVILFQHTVLDDGGEINNYRFYTHFFSNNDILKFLNPTKFKNPQLFTDVLPETDLWNGENVIFCIAEK